MTGIMLVQGRELSAEDLGLIQGLLADHRDWGRTRLSEELCRRWDWRNALGRIKDMAARTLLLKLERGGQLDWPRADPRTHPPGSGADDPRSRQRPLRLSVAQGFPPRFDLSAPPADRRAGNPRLPSLPAQQQAGGGQAQAGRPMTRHEQLLRQIRSDPQGIVAQILELEQQVQDLKAKVQTLEDRLAQNSGNSSKPPSSGGLAKKPVLPSLRKKTGRKPGGQPGHPGRTLQPVQKPQYQKVHPLEACPCGQCGGVSLKRQPVLDYERRQVFDLAPMRLEVTEHQAEIKRCPISGLTVKAAFPAGVEAPVQYRPHFRGLMVYFYNQQILPFDRLHQVYADLFGQPLSLGTLTQTNERAHVALAPVESLIVQGLHQAGVVHLDESGLRVAGSLHWLHVASTSELTFYGVHDRRGTEAMDALGVVPHCHHWLMHDHWKPYHAYEALHALCNQHLLRELKFLSEQHQETWATKMSGFLLKEKNAPQTALGLNEKQFKRDLAKYRTIVRKGRKHHPRLAAGQGHTRQSRAANLLDRLQDYDLSVLVFLVDPQVPFTNNQAEQDIRMVKVKQKISGGFRTLKGAEVFARIRSYLSTCRKQGLNLWEASMKAVIGQPFMPFIPVESG